MKPFITWLALALIAFGSMSGIYHYHLVQNPRKVLVALDTSYPMREVWYQVPAIFETFNQYRYTQFSLITDKNIAHTWSSSLEAVKVTPYAPRDLSQLAGTALYPELKHADKRFLLTNAPEGETKNLEGWEVIRLTP
jgi:hypothetical protein